MTIFYLIGHIITWAVFIYFAANTIYLFTMALCGRLVKSNVYKFQDKKYSIAVLIPSFREDQIIVDTALHAKAHNYPASRFMVTVIADKLKPETIQKLKQIPVDVMEVNLSMKSRSLHAALESPAIIHYDIVMILDADNIMAPGCLEKVNAAFHAGIVAMQCHRTAKNKNTEVALLDAMSEEININLFRRGPSLAGLSATPNGSGMAFDTALIRDIFSSKEILDNPGEDREIDMQLMQRKIKMEFLDDALIYDEKVATARVFEKQRIRWLEAQANHVKRFFDSDMRKAQKTIIFFNKFIQNLLLPRVLTLVVFSVITVMLLVQHFFYLPLIRPAPVAWIAMMSLYLLTLLISIPRIFYSTKTLRALSRLPLLMYAMMRAVLQMKKKRKEYIHTPKSFISEESAKPKAGN
jgi:cellulose synthase/poly-beta-1,6-N-acetylglucosamine synthase-like glycosyltransferase